MSIRAPFLVLFLAPGLAMALNVGIWDYADCLCGNPNGFATASAWGGTPPYSYFWSNGAIDATAIGLAPGTYTVTVTDAVMDVATAQVTIGEVPTTLYTSFSGAGLHGCNGLCNGGRNITIYPLPPNLTPPVTFWPPLSVDNGGPIDGSYGLYTGLCPGEQLEFTVTDGTGCQLEVIDNWTPESSTPSPMSILGVTPACGALATGSVTIDAGLDATSPFGAVWEVVILNEAMQQVGGSIGGLNTAPDQNVATREGLPAGNYYAKRYFMWHPEDCQDLVPFTIPDLGIDCGLLTGTAFVDHNLSCTRQTNEPWVPNALMEVLPGPYYTATNANGQYNLVLPPGTYTVQQQGTILNEHCTGAPIPFTITNGASSTVHHPDTALVPLDVSISLSSGAARPGFQFDYALVVWNQTPATSGAVTVTFTFDPTLTFVSSSPMGSVVGNTITWNQAQLSAWQTRSFSVRFQVPPDVGLMGYELVGTATVGTANTDGEPANNTAVNYRTITGSYDPNDKLAVTSLGSNSAWLIDQDEWVDYTIRFQNTGTDTAFTVVITDTLPGTLDPATLNVGAASHAFNWSLSGPGIITFNFPGILLPDSNVNEPLSHGFVGFRIRPRLPVLPGTTITNIANIYFDFNPPIITEPSVLVAEFSTGVGEASTAALLTAYPNPADDRLMLVLEGIEGPVKLVVHAMDGRTVATGTALGEHHTLVIGHLAEGAYTLQATGTDGRIHRTRFIKD
jgi:uncharacterized repeat protein (TIGR01451 family)